MKKVALLVICSILKSDNYKIEGNRKEEVQYLEDLSRLI
jgi:hypothetical protein